jgi:membrane protease YdiL (CAAX protease family)
VNYFQLSRSARYSILFAVPLLLAYEALAFALGGGATAGVRNGADVLLKSLFLALGGQRGLLVFDVVLLAVGATLIWRDRHTGGPLRPWIFAAMLGESMGLAIIFGTVVGIVTALLLQGPAALALGGLADHGLATQVMLSLGAGIYEELLFRVILVSGLAFLARRIIGWLPGASNVAAVLLGALIFSAFHYIGPYGDAWELQSFTFRFVAGLALNALYVVRGFGIAAWTHALYDVILSILGTG